MKRRIGAKPGGFPVVPYTHEFERNGEWQCRELEFQFSVEPIVPGKYFSGHQKIVFQMKVAT
jgi:hypothetical protein